MKLKFYLSSFLFILSGILFVNAQEKGEMVFSASKKAEKAVDAPSSTTVIDAKTIENRPTTNVTQLLDNVVGLTLDRQGANRYNITLRDGASVFNTTSVVLLDGRQISTIGLQVFDAANTNLSGLDLEKIEVVRGSGSSTYGAYTNSGVVHFMSKDPFKYPGTSIEISSGGLANQESMLGKGNWDIFQASLRHAAANDGGTFGYKINARYSENGEYEIDEATALQTGGQLLEKANGYNIDATLYFRPSSNLEITAQAGISAREGLSWSEFYAEAFENNENNFFSLKMRSGNLTAQYSVSKSESPFDAADQGYYYRTTQTNTFKNTNDIKESQAQIQYDLTLGTTDISVGLDHKLSSFNTNWNSQASTPQEMAAGGLFGRNDGSEMRVYGTYFQTNTSISDNVNLILGGRYDQYTNINEGAFAPKASLMFKTSPTSSIRLTASQATTSSNAQTMFADHLGFSWGLPNQIAGNATQQTFNNPYVTWAIPGIDQIQAANPVFYQGLGLDLFSIYLGLLPQMIPALSQSVVGLFVNVPAFLQNPIVWNSVVANSFIIPVELVGNNTNLEPSDTASIGTETTYEIGYKAELGKFKVGVDVYRQTKENFSALEIISPFAQFPASAATDIADALGFTFGRALGGGLLGQILGQIMGNGFATGYMTLTGAPVGIVNSDQSFMRGPINFGYKNFGEIEFYGADISTEYAATEDISLFANYSWLSQNFFEKADIGEGETSGSTYNLNTPKHRVKAGMSYYPSKGFSGGLSMRYQNSFTANQGWYSGFVPKRTVWDAHFGYKFSQKTQLGVNVSNLLGKKYRVYSGMPEIGTSAVASLKYQF
mgnify:FL=1